jgi:hypothetical protein
MAKLDASTAKIAWTTSGATAACHTGTQFALLHCTKGANLAAGDRSPAGKVKLFDAVELEGSVFSKPPPRSSTSATARSAWCKRRN